MMLNATELDMAAKSLWFAAANSAASATSLWPSVSRWAAKMPGHRLRTVACAPGRSLCGLWP